MPCVADRHRDGVSRRVRESLRVDRLSRTSPRTAMTTRSQLATDPTPGLTLAGVAGGRGAPLVCLHGLTATRRYVLQGSRAAGPLGRRLVVAYDARGHGESSPPPTTSTATPSWWPTSRACWTTAASTGACWPAARWAPPRPWRSPWTSPAGWTRWCRSRPPTTAQARTGVVVAGELGRARRRAWTPATSTRSWQLTGVDELPERFRDSARTGRAPARRAPRAPRGRGRGAAPGAALGGLRRPGPAGGGGRAGAGGGQPRRRRPRAPAGRGRASTRAGCPARELVVEDEGEPPLAWQGARLRARSPAFLRVELLVERGARCARSSRPPGRPPSSPGSCPSTAAPARARRPARPGARSGGGCPRGPRRTAASSTGR